MGRSLILELHFCLCVLLSERKEKKKRRGIKEREGEGKSVAVDVAKFCLLQLFILRTITIKHNSNINSIFLIYKTRTYVQLTSIWKSPHAIGVTGKLCSISAISAGKIRKNEK